MLRRHQGSKQAVVPRGRHGRDIDVLSAWANQPYKYRAARSLIQLVQPSWWGGVSCRKGIGKGTLLVSSVIIPPGSFVCAMVAFAVCRVSCVRCWRAHRGIVHDRTRL